MKRLKAILIGLLLALAIVPAKAQSIQQSGAITPGHPSCWVITGVIDDCGAGVPYLLNGNFQLYLDTAGHLRNQGSAPTLSSCGTSPAISGTDIAGTVTMGTGSPTGCTITFATAYVNAPDCIVTWQTNLASMQYTNTNAAITLVQTGTSSNKINYFCPAKSGG